MNIVYRPLTSSSTDRLYEKIQDKVCQNSFWQMDTKKIVPLSWNRKTEWKDATRDFRCRNLEHLTTNNHSIAYILSHKTSNYFSFWFHEPLIAGVGVSGNVFALSFTQNARINNVTLPCTRVLVYSQLTVYNNTIIYRTSHIINGCETHQANENFVVSLINVT